MGVAGSPRLAPSLCTLSPWNGSGMEQVSVNISEQITKFWLFFSYTGPFPTTMRESVWSYSDHVSPLSPGD